MRMKKFDNIANNNYILYTWNNIEIYYFNVVISGKPGGVDIFIPIWEDDADVVLVHYIVSYTLGVEPSFTYSETPQSKDLYGNSTPFPILFFGGNELWIIILSEKK